MCTKLFGSKRLLTRHKEIHHQDGAGERKGSDTRVYCEVCSEQMSSLKKKAHMELFHLLPVDFSVPCPLCSVSVKFLPFHFNKCHRQVNVKRDLFPCRRCRRYFLSLSALQEHQVDHALYGCEVCGAEHLELLQLGWHCFHVHSKVFNLAGTQNRSRRVANLKQVSAPRLFDITVPDRSAEAVVKAEEKEVEEEEEVEVDEVGEEEVEVDEVGEDETSDEEIDSSVLEVLVVEDGTIERITKTMEVPVNSDSSLQNFDVPIHTSDPSLKSFNSSLQVSDPSLQISDPSIQSWNPSLQSSDPSIQTSDSTLQSSDPSLQTSDPSLQSSDPSLQLLEVELNPDQLETALIPDGYVNLEDTGPVPLDQFYVHKTVPSREPKITNYEEPSQDVEHSSISG